MPAAIIGPAIGAIGSIAGGILGSGAASKAGKTVAAANTQAANTVQSATAGGLANINGSINNSLGAVESATQSAQDLAGSGTAAANKTLQGVFDQQQQNLSPYLAAGTQGATALSLALQPGGSLAGQFAAPTAAEAEATPGYQFQLDQGNSAVQRSAAASGTLRSGGTLKALDQYSQGLASTYYQNAYNNALNTFQTNHNNTMQGLTALTNLGQFGTQQYNTAAQNYGNTTAQNLMNNGQYQGNVGLQGAQLESNIDLGGNVSAAQLGLQGATTAGNFQVGAGNAQAAGTLGAANAWQGALNGVSGAAGSTAQALINNRPSGTTTTTIPSNSGYYGSIPSSGYPISTPTYSSNLSQAKVDDLNA